MCYRSKCILCADETVLDPVGTTLEGLTDHVNSRLSNKSEWCNCNKVSLYTLKLELMFVTNWMLVAWPQILIGSDLTKDVNSFKYLDINTVARQQIHCSKYVYKNVC